MLAEEEHEQKYGEMYQLLVAQLNLDGQRKHGNSLVFAGRPANLLRVGFGGYEYPGRVIRAGSWPPDDVDASTPGINRRRPELSGWRQVPNS